ncbi:MAG: hypothetical protein ACOC80_15805 [Petrotogales bacterium]
MEPAVYFENWMWTCGATTLLFLGLAAAVADNERLFNFSWISMIVSIVGLAFFTILRIWV